MLVWGVTAMEPKKSTTGLVVALSLSALALSGCSSSNSGLSMSVESIELQPRDSWGDEYLKVTVLVKNHHPSKDFSTLGDEEAQLSGGPWSAVSNNGLIFGFSEGEGPDGIAAGSSGTISVLFYANALDSGDYLVKLRYESGGLSTEAKIPATKICPGHWHSTLSVFVEGERVVFTANPQYTLEGGTMPVRTHMHQGSESRWHFEPAEQECIPLREALATVNVRLESGRLELSGDYHQNQGWGGVYEGDNERLLRAWIHLRGGDWASLEVAELAAMQVPDGAQVLVAFGAYDEAEVARMQEDPQ